MTHTHYTYRLPNGYESHLYYRTEESAREAAGGPCEIIASESDDNCLPLRTDSDDIISEKLARAGGTMYTRPIERTEIEGAFTLSPDFARARDEYIRTLDIPAELLECGTGHYSQWMNSPHGPSEPLQPLTNTAPFPPDCTMHNARWEDREPYEPDLDNIPYSELGEQSPMYAEVSDALTTWATERPYDSHGIGIFLDELAARGYRVTPIEVPDMATILPPSTD